MTHRSAGAHISNRGFTLIEILVSVGVLLAVVVVTGRIFKVATDVTSVGQATVDIMQEAAAIESRIRQDIAMMSREGFLVIKSVEVPNDINIQQWNGNGERPGLLNSMLDADDTLRCDQLAFFKESPESSQVFSSGTALGAHPSAQGQMSFITIGHGIQLPQLYPFTPVGTDMSYLPDDAPPPGYGHDPWLEDPQGRAVLTPWRYDNPASAEDSWLPTVFTDYVSPIANLYQQYIVGNGPGYVNATQPEARQWVLARQQVLLADDDNQYPGHKSKRQYLQNVPSARSIFPRDARLSVTSDGDGNANTIGQANLDPNVLAYGRVDVAAIPIDEVRELLTVSRDANSGSPQWNFMRRCMHYDDQIDEGDCDSDGDNILEMEPRAVRDNVFNLPPGTYYDQRFLMKDVVHWPRAERKVPSFAKADQVLSGHVLGSACSSFMVEWTYSEGTGGAEVPHPTSPRNDFFFGVHYSPWSPLLADTTDPDYSDEPWLGQRWFGLRDIERGVMPYEEFVDNFGWLDYGVSADQIKDNPTSAAWAVNPFAIDRERGTFGQPTVYEEYWATFGLNQERPYLPLVQNFGNLQRHAIDPSFTPWPSALRITMTLHDPGGRMEHGQVYQFVVEIPRQSLGIYAGES